MVMNFLFWLILLTLVWIKTGATGSRDHIRLRNDLFKNPSRLYDRTVRPVVNISTTTFVQMQFFVGQLLDVDERLQTLKMNVWLTLRWYDEFLTWDPDDYSGIDDFKITKENIWMPDLWLYQNADNKYEDFTFNTQAVISYTGQVMWAAPTIIKSHCAMDVGNFPFDKQMCNISFGPWLHNAREILINGTGHSDYFLGDTEWYLMHFGYANEQLIYQYYPDDDPEPFSTVVYIIGFQRLPIYHVFYLIMPCFLISSTTIFSFFLPAESGEKVGLGITVLLSLTVFLLLMAETLPPMKNKVPILGQFYAATMLLVSISIMMSVIVLNLHHHTKSTPVPKWIQRLLLGKVANFVLFRKVNKSNVPLRQVNQSNGHNQHCEEEIERGNGEEGKKGAQSPRSEVLYTPLNRPVRERSQRNVCQHPSNNTKTLEPVYVLKELLLEFRDFKTNFERQNKDDKHYEEWKQVAMVIDRIFLILYVIGTITTIATIGSQMDFTSF